MSASIMGIGGSHGPHAMTGASAIAPPSHKMASVFSQFTTPGSGVITKDQLTQAFNTMNPTAGFRDMGVDALFSALDPSGSGSVSRQDFIKGMTNLMAQFRASGQSGG
jgi:Ca2+-binding EF-hand superfamily protein